MYIFTFQLSDFKKWPLIGLYIFLFSGQIFAGGEKKENLALTCPDDVFVNPVPGECGTFIDFSTLQWSSTLPVASHNFNPGAQNYFTYGITPVTLTVTSTSGTQESCVFHVFVEQFPTPLACNQSVFVFMADSCHRTVTADLLLLGGPYGCNDVYDVTIFNDQGEDIGNTVTPDMVGDIYNVEILDEQTFLSCFATIIPRPDSLPQFINCPPDVTIRCHEPLTPDWTGEPQYETCFEESEVEVGYEDEMVNNSFCDGDDIAFEVVRTWSVINPFEGTTSCQQVILGKRLLLTEVIFPPDYDGTDQPALTCSDTLEAFEAADTSVTGIPLVNGFDPHFLPCNFSVTYSDSIQNICGNSYSILRTWEAWDYCEDETLTHTQHIVIEDVEAPVFSVPNPIFASSQSICGPVADLPPIDLVRECSPFEVSISTPWGDINGNGGEIEIPLQAGQHPVTYSATDACGNENMLTTTLVIQNDILIECPPTMAISNQYYFQNILPLLNSGNLGILAEFGYPELAANCDFTLTEFYLQTLDNCAEGDLVRTFGLVESNEECTQTILIEHVSDFVVSFPPDTTFVCGSGPGSFEEPTLTNDETEDIEISFSDEIVMDSASFCYQIQRTWVVKNNCVTGSQDDNETFEVAEADLGLPFPECDLDGDGDCDDRTFRDSWSSAQMPGESEAAQTFNPDTDPDSDPWDGFITFVQTINVVDSVAPIFVDCEVPSVCIEGSGCEGEVILPVPEIMDCGNFTMSAQISFGGPTQSGLGPFPNVAPGNYEVTYFAVDDCGNEASCETIISVTECTPPTPVCNFQQILTIGPGTPPSAAVLASSLNNGSFDNCPGGLQFSLSPTPGDLSRVYFCDDLGQQTLTLYVTDQAGNQDSCDIFLLIQEPSPGFCGGSSSMTLPGNIFTETNLGIEGVEVASSQGFTALTDVDGAYSVGYENMGSNLTLTSFLDSNPSNGVTTFDALLIVKHVLGTELLDSPYKLISADVNASNSVTTFDALVIRQMVLGLISEFPSGSWRFVPEEFNFPNPTDPFAFPFPESASVPIPPPSFGPDFVGTKVGDVNNSADPNLMAMVDERNFDGSINFTLSDVYVKKGEAISIPVHLPEKVLHGFQFALFFDLEKLELLEVEKGILDENAFGKNELEKGVLKTSWYSAVPVKYTPETTAFTLRFLPKKEGRLSEMLALKNEKMPAEAYSSDLKKREVKLHFAPQKTMEKNLVLYPNRPDPFSEKTLVPFELPEAGEVELKVFDISGRAVKNHRQHFAGGYHILEIWGHELPGTGVYFFQIKTQNGTAEGKMVRGVGNR